MSLALQKKKGGKWLKPVNEKNSSGGDRRVRTVLRRLAEGTSALPDREPGLVEVLFFLEDRQRAVRGAAGEENNMRAAQGFYFSFVLLKTYVLSLSMEMFI